MNYTKSEKRVINLIISITIAFWLGLLAGICDLTVLAIAATVYCIVGIEIILLSLKIKVIIGRQIIYGGIALLVFSIPVICLFC